jgi:hypothetical protein
MLMFGEAAGIINDWYSRYYKVDHADVIVREGLSERANIVLRCFSFLREEQVTHYPLIILTRHSVFRG